MRLAPSVFVSGTADTTALSATFRAEGFETGRPSRVTFTVLDTIDGRLHVNGLRLVATEAESLTLSLSGPDIAVGNIAADSLPIRAADLPAGPWRESVAAASGERLLLVQATLVATRTVATLRSGSGNLRSLVTVDAKFHLAGRSKALASTVTVHRVAGKGKARRRAEALCTDAGLRAHADALGELLDEADVDLTGISRSPSGLDATTLAIDGFRAVLTDLLVAVEGYWRGAAHSSDPAFVYGLRVATRRSRSVLIEGKTVLPREALSMAAAGMGVLSACTGRARDLDVYLAGWDGYISNLPPESAAALAPVRETLEARRRRAYDDLAVGLASPAVKTFVRDWSKWLRKPVPGRSMTRSPDGHRQLTGFVIERIGQAHLTLLEHGRLITDDSPATQLHDLRRDAKRLRYLLESFGEVLPAKPTRRFVRRLKSLQDNLGAHQDAEVHATRMAELLVGPEATEFSPATLAAADELVRQLEQQCLSARAEFSSRFSEYDSPATQAALALIVTVPTPELKDPASIL